MKIAVTYENGEIFQHFGHTKQFKIYEFDDADKVLDVELVDANGSGHGALAGFLKDHGVNVLICGALAEEHKWRLQKLASKFLVA